MGSHSSYSKRYPSEFNIFSGENGKEQTIAAYDNSILYNDFIVDSLLSMLAKSTPHNQFSTAVYLSDHGENVYDEMDKVGHDYSNKLPKANVEIPFLLWSSPAFQEMKADKMLVINSNTNKPFVADDLFHSILDLNGIKSTYLEEERSIFNKNFNEKRVRILEDGKNYDD
jgi:heptose-I-phosphate ethanolaminephosphotransferase